jgi:hypothetical protein
MSFAEAEPIVPAGFGWLVAHALACSADILVGMLVFSRTSNITKHVETNLDAAR